MDPEIEEGGGAYIKSGNWCGACRTQLSVRVLILVPWPLHIRRLQYIAQKPENEATHAQSCRGVWGHVPPGKF